MCAPNRRYSVELRAGGEPISTSLMGIVICPYTFRPLQTSRPSYLSHWPHAHRLNCTVLSMEAVHDEYVLYGTLLFEPFGPAVPV